MQTLLKTLPTMSLATALAVALPGCDSSNTEQDGKDDGISASTAGDDAGAVTGSEGNEADTAADDNAADDNAPADTTAAGGADDEGANDDPGPPPIKLDLGVIPDAPDFDTACRKVDFLFVIDNSGSMFTYQQELVNNFPVFIDGIQSSLDSVMSYQVGVVTTDAYNFNAAGCTNLSSLVVQTGGGDSSNMACGPYSEGNNFMTEEDDLGTAFTCAAQVGTSGNGLELTMQAVEETVTRTDGGPGQCNDGFLRDDALLVVVIITDEADGPGDPEGFGGIGTSAGTPASWFQTVVEAKDGIPENVVVLSLINYAGGACPPTSDSFDGQNIADFTTMFGDNGFLGGICEPDYGPIFEEAVGVIDEACENYVTPG